MGGVDTLDPPPAAACSAALVVAVGRLSQRLDQLEGTWMSSRDEILGALREIAVGVERACACPGRAQEPVKVTNLVLYHRLTEALRGELLSGWSPQAEGDASENTPENAQAVLTLLCALEGYRVRLLSGKDNELAARLADPDALELVVEVAHDLRSPLNSILFLAEVLRSGQSGEVSPHQRGQLGLIYGATMGMISVVNDVMELARDPQGTGDEEPSRFSIGRVFDSVHEVVRPIAEEKKIALEFTIPDYDHCVGRPMAIGRVVLNLTINALKFTEIGSVSVSARRIDRSRVTFAVQDTGRGISPSVQPHLFQPFQRAGSRDRYFFAKAGLGLSIARRLVRSMGSELSFETEEGKGTVFYFTLELPSVDSARA
jgi:signal transduction histidine kinase